MFNPSIGWEAMLRAVHVSGESKADAAAGCCCEANHGGHVALFGTMSFLPFKSIYAFNIIEQLSLLFFSAC